MLKKLREIYKSESPYMSFLLTLIVCGLGYGIYKGVLDNYLAEIVGMGELDRGVTEFFRELPGLLLVFILALFYRFSAQALYKIGSIIMLLGMVMISVVPPGKALVTIAICTYSLGEHIQLGMKNTLSLEYSKEGKGGQALGYQNAITQIGTLGGYGVVIVAFMLMSSVQKPYRAFFIAST